MGEALKKKFLFMRSSLAILARRRLVPTLPNMTVTSSSLPLGLTARTWPSPKTGVGDFLAYFEATLGGWLVGLEAPGRGRGSLRRR